MPTKIEWTHLPGTIGESWNPVTGCSKISEGCKFCYAERMARRLAGRYGYPEYPHHFDVTLHPGRLEIPLWWEKPRTVFVCSMSDLFHEDIPFEEIWSIWKIMRECQQHTFQILTKRPKRMMRDVPMFYCAGEQPLSNIWLGVTAENQRAADERIPLLLQIPAAVRFVSCEPLLGPIDLHEYLGLYKEADFVVDCIDIGGQKPSFVPMTRPGFPGWRRHDGIKLSWIIVGGESGPNARPMNPQWAKDIRDQCQAAGVPFFFKSWGAWAPYIESSFVGEVTGHKVLPNGTLGELGDGNAGTGMSRVGKKRAGRLLAGREWNEFPVMPCGHPKAAIRGNGITHWCHLCEKEGAE